MRRSVVGQRIGVTDDPGREIDSRDFQNTKRGDNRRVEVDDRPVADHLRAADAQIAKAIRSLNRKRPRWRQGCGVGRRAIRFAGSAAG